jgi:hypothetical protein
LYILYINFQMKKDDKISPLLDQDIKKEFSSLQDEHTIFNNSVSDLEKTFNLKSVEDFENLKQINNKLSHIKNHMEKISEKIAFIKNYIKDHNDNSTLFLLNQIKKISESIGIKYERVNHNFTELIKNAQNHMQLELIKTTGGVGITSTLNKSGSGTAVTTFATKSPGETSKIRMGYERIKEIQKEYEVLLDASSKLVQISIEIKKQTDKQGYMVSSIEDEITSAEHHTKEADGELKKTKERQSSNVSMYFWISLALCFVIVIIVYVLYLKYFKTSTSTNQPNSNQTTV